MAKRQLVRILNPGAGAHFTSPKAAIKYVKQGRARIAGEHSIEFIESDQRHLAVLKSIGGDREGNEPTPIYRKPLLEIVPSSTGTSEYTTFGRYPMFPEKFGKRAA